MMQKARELSDLLAKTPEVLAYSRAEERMLNDPAVTELRREMEERLAVARVCAQIRTEDAEESRRAYEEAEDAWRSHLLVAEYEKAKEDLDLLMECLNAAIMHPITGQDGTAPAGCAGCSRRGRACH